VDSAGVVCASIEKILYVRRRGLGKQG